MYAPLAQDPASFGPKSCLLVNYSPNPSSVPNLKQLASRVSDIIRESHFLDTSLAQTPANFGPPKVVSWYHTPQTQVVYILNLELLASMVADISRWSQVFFGCSPRPDPLQFCL